MKYKVFSEKIDDKMDRYYRIFYIIFALFLLFLTFYTYFSIHNIFWKYYYVVLLIFLFTLIVSLIVYRAHHFKNTTIIEIQIEDTEIKFYRRANSFSIKYDWFITYNVLVKVASSNRWHPTPKIFEFYEFLDNGYEYIEKEIEKISRRRRSNTIIILSFYEQKSKLSTKLSFSFFLSLSVIPLPVFKQMINEWQYKYNRYLKMTGCKEFEGSGRTER